MELGQLRQLLMLLKDNGVTQYRDGDLELTLGAASGNAEPAGEVTENDRKRQEFLEGIPSQYHRAFEVKAGA